MAEILIKNMEMPKDDENLTIVIEADGSVWQKIGNSAYFCTCGKAIELPPHGRLIDADVIGNWLREQHEFSMPTTCKIDSIIKNAPTVLPASEGE